MVFALPLAPLIAIIPLPASVTLGEGAFKLTPSTAITAPDVLRNEARYLAEALGRGGIGTNGQPSDGAINLVVDKSVSEEEGYVLEVTDRRVTIRAGKPAGIFYGIQSLRQMSSTIPVCKIVDSPRFSWRGSHLDVGRHFMPKAFILKYLDLMAQLKLNVFHWHLTDDQGWRIEIKKYPKLTQIGAFRKDTMLVYDPVKWAGEPHGGFYTQEDIKEVVRFAAARHITVVPEIEMPGHAQAAIAAYPELGNLNEPLEVATRWGVIPNVFNVKDSTISFLKDVLDEVMALFPGKFIHIGGDECPKDQWKKSSFAQAKIKKLGLKDEHELQSWFIQQMDDYLDSKGRRLIGWSEILEGGLAPGAALMVWLGDDGAMQAVKSGHDVVMAQTTHTYFDYYQAKDRTKEPHAIGGFLPIDKVYQYEPILPGMTAEQASHVMGVQYQLWTEYIREPKQVEYMAFPRACALAEVAWTPKALRSFEGFMGRLPSFCDRLTAQDVNFRRLDPGM